VPRWAAPRGDEVTQPRGGPSFLLLLFSYITQGMLFWGITLWIPLAVRSLGFIGTSQALASSLPYFAAVAMAVPMAKISDHTGHRILIASLGMLIPGVLMIMLPLVDNGDAKLALTEET
jgi:MFS family permease